MVTPDAADKMAKALADLWLRNRTLVEERFAMLDQVAAAAAAGTLDEVQRKEAAGIAHKLAGSLGLYGYDEGTRVARELEVLLAGGSCDGVRLQSLCGELRAAVFPKG